MVALRYTQQNLKKQIHYKGILAANNFPYYLQQPIVQKGTETMTTAGQFHFSN